MAATRQERQPTACEVCGAYEGICRQLLREQRQRAIAQELHGDAIEAFAQCLDRGAVLLPLGSPRIEDESGAAPLHRKLLGGQGKREGLL